MLQTSRVVDAVDRLKGVFLEVPGATLTLAEAVSVSGLDTVMCEVVLHALEDAGFLAHTGAGFVIRADWR